MRIFTIGHSTRSFDELVEALRSFGVRTLVDIRTVPRSRHVPQFNAESLRRTLPNRRIRYRHMKALGGLRKPRADSTNTAWRNTGFRGFADYMETREFAEALDALRALSRDAGPVAIMCAEAVPWRCHRSLVADALIGRGDEVVDIMAPGKWTAHRLTPWAHVEDHRVTYPGPPPPPSSRASRRGPAREKRPGKRADALARSQSAKAKQGALWK